MLAQPIPHVEMSTDVLHDDVAHVAPWQPLLSEVSNQGLAAILQLARAEGEDLGTTVLEFAEKMTDCEDCQCTHTKLTVAMTEHTRMSARVISMLVKTSAALLVLHQRVRHAAFEAAVVRAFACAELIHYFEVGAFVGHWRRTRCCSL